MRYLIVGGAGHVGRIITPALESAFECRHFDLKPVAGAEDRTIVGSVLNDDDVQRAVEGVDGIIYLAMGWGRDPKTGAKDCNVIGPAFDVNVQGVYRFLRFGLAAGARRFIYTSTLSVYDKYLRHARPLDESHPADCWDPYGFSKRLGEFICQSAHEQYPDAMIISLRLIQPRNEEQWPHFRYDPKSPHNSYGIGPNDLRRLYLAAARFDRPGYYFVQGTGDMEGHTYPNTKAYELLGWKPENE